MARKPRLSDQVTTLETTGVRSGNAGRLSGVTPLFDVAAEQGGYAPARSMTIEERFVEKVTDAADLGTLPPFDPTAHQQASVTDQGLDSSALDTQGASSGEAEQMNTGEAVAMDTTAPTTTARDITTEIGPQEAVTAPEGTSPTGLNISDEETTSAPEVSNDADLESLTNADLIRLAAERGVKVKSGANKAELIAALTDGE